ncbi:MAG TPA: DUF2304 domain-containing protein [Terriglobales bacterium]|nr:DUF2304 domain-containing protein [Terriglobales bacterium]
MAFLSRTQVITAVGAVLLVLYVLDLVRRRKLSEEYSLLWVICSVVIAALGFSTPLLTWITRTLGMMGASSTVFAFGLGFTMAMLLHLSVKLSRLGQENHALTRELALLRHELEGREAAGPRAPGTVEGA